MDSALDALYLNWLYSCIERPDDPSYFELLDIMFKTKFEWLVPNDDNRALDGIDLRRRFIFEQATGHPPSDWMQLDCSFLEMLVALANRLAFQLDESVPNAFWHLARNMGFDETFSDGNFDPQEVEDILTMVMWRTYDYKGQGGLFPREAPDKDQREVELLYQMYGYVIENKL